jgi:hypothetical protein
MGKVCPRVRFWAKSKCYHEKIGEESIQKLEKLICKTKSRNPS